MSFTSVAHLGEEMLTLYIRSSFGDVVALSDEVDVPTAKVRLSSPLLS